MPSASEEIVLVHGLWYGPWSMRVLALRLRGFGFPVRLFSYPTITGEFSAHADALARFAAASKSSTCHFVGHSLGGLLILGMLHQQAQVPEGRVVLLGSPLRGSSAARSMLNWRVGPRMLGSAANTLRDGFAQLPPGKQVGMVAGTRPIGLGRLAGGGAIAGDGAVALHETNSPALTARVILPVSHTGMLFSRETARKVASFLAHGHF